MSRSAKPPVPFLHPRPPRDPRIVATNLAMVYVCAVQTFAGPAPSSVNARAFTPHFNVIYLGVLTLCSLLVFAAAYVRSEYLSVSLEMIGCVGGAVVYFLFTLAAANNVTGWYTTQSTAWSVAFAAGSAIRVLQLLDQISGYHVERRLGRILRRRR